MDRDPLNGISDVSSGSDILDAIVTSHTSVPPIHINAPAGDPNVVYINPPSLVLVEKIEKDEPQELKPLSLEEDTFCLAVIEYGGNIKYAYESTYGVGASNPTARARVMLARPEIAYRVRELTESITENALISLGSHLVELADIRDTAKMSGQLKTALDAEISRGKVAGFYAGKEGTGTKGGGDNPYVVIQISNATDRAI